MGALTASGRLRPWGALYVTLHLLPVALLLAYLCGSLLLAGGRISAGGARAWPAVLPAPVFAVPWWVAVAPMIGGVAVAAVWAFRSTRQEAGALSGAFGPTLGAVISTVFFAFLALGGTLEDGPWWLGVLAGLASSAILLTTSYARDPRGWRSTIPTKADT